jgi:N-methylhydantoinase B
LVAREVRNGIISLEKARNTYGVAVDPQSFQVNQNETKRLREDR